MLTKLQIIKSFLDFGHFHNPRLTGNLISENDRNDKIKITDSRVFFGTSGNGKTTQAILFLRDWLSDKFPNGFEISRYRELPTFLEMSFFESYVADKNGFEEDRRYSARIALEEAKTADLLILDDLWEVQGTPRAVQAIKRELFEIFDYRYNQNLQTIITTNLDLQELQTRDEDYKRIVDRILGLCIPTKFTAPSYRTESHSLLARITKQKQVETI
jgi:DNA replication protein DnaC